MRSHLSRFLVLLAVACGASPEPPPDVSDAGSSDASEPDAGVPELDAGPCECERGTPMHWGTCAESAGCDLLECKPGWVCVYPYGVSVDYTIHGSEGVGSSRRRSVHRAFSAYHLPNDSDGGACFRKVENRRVTMYVSVTHGVVDGDRIEGFGLTLVDFGAARSFELRPDTASQFGASVFFWGLNEHFSVDTTATGQCTVTVGADGLSGEIHCTGLSGGGGPIYSGPAPAPGVYAVEATWSCVTLLDR